LPPENFLFKKILANSFWSTVHSNKTVNCELMTVNQTFCLCKNF